MNKRLVLLVAASSMRFSTVSLVVMLRPLYVVFRPLDNAIRFPGDASSKRKMSGG